MTGNDDLGNVQIERDVVATIAGIAMADVDGIVNQSGKRLLDPLRSQKAPDKGIKVEIEENRVSLTLEVRILYGQNIYDTSRRLQQTVKNQVEGLTGLIVERVDVNVLGVALDAKGRRGREDEESPAGDDYPD